MALLVVQRQCNLLWQFVVMGHGTNEVARHAPLQQTARGTSIWLQCQRSHASDICINTVSMLQLSMQCLSSLLRLRMVMCPNTYGTPGHMPLQQVAQGTSTLLQH